VSRFWSFYFLLMPLAVLAVFAVAPFLGWSLPDSVSRMGDDIDFLYRVILFITGTVFLGTQFFLCYTLIRYRDRPGREAQYSHGNKKAELVWTVVPAAIIAGMAALQMPTWRKLQELPAKDEAILARVIGRRYEWRVIHAGPDRKLDTADDVILTNQLHLPPGKRVWVELRAEDVVHALFLPQFRMKQDAVPGMKIMVPLDAHVATSEYRERHADFLDVDLENYGALAKLLKPANRAADKLLKEKLADFARQSVDAYEPEAKADPRVEHDVIRALNEIINSKLLDGDAAFKDIVRSKETTALLTRAAKTGKQEVWKKTINRALVADAYPKIVRRLQKDYELICAELCGEGHYQMQGKAVVHDDESDFDAWLKEAQTGDPQESGR
jgi:cytochrome c oxidase subunit II